MKLFREENENELIIKRLHHIRHYSLTLDKGLCVGCELCKSICPVEAIRIQIPQREEKGKVKRPMINIDEKKCFYCGLCDSICPFGAIQIKLNGNRFNMSVDKETFPQLIRDITVDTSRCPLDCIECEKACPLNLIKVKVINSIVQVEVKKENCPACRLCELKCPKDAIRVRRIFYGKLIIRQEKCPDDCQDCLNVCPIMGALYISDGKIYVNELLCVYCGVCKLICPVSEALKLSRTGILCTYVRSGTWHKALEKVTSTLIMSKDLKIRGSVKAIDSVKRRV